MCISRTHVASTPLILGRFLQVIDSKNVDRSFGGLQFQAELLLEGGEKGRTTGIGWRRRVGVRRQTNGLGARFVRRGRPFQRKVVAALDAGLIQPGSV